MRLVLSVLALLGSFVLVVLTEPVLALAAVLLLIGCFL
jgi:hypothetical protein